MNLRRNAVPFAAGVAAAAAAFTVVLLTTDDDGNGRAPGSVQVAAPAPGAPRPEGREGGLAVFTRMGCFGERMSDAELDALLDFLLAARGPR